MSDSERARQEGRTAPRIDLEKAREALNGFRANIRGSNPPETELDRFLNGHRFLDGNGAYEDPPIVDEYGNVDMGKRFDSRETKVLLNIGDVYPGFQFDLKRAIMLDGRNKKTLSEGETLELPALRRAVHIQFLSFLKSEGVPAPDYISGGLMASEPPKTGGGEGPPTGPPDEDSPFGEYKDDGSLERFVKVKEKMWGRIFAICNGGGDELRRLEGELKSKGLLAADGSIYDALHDFFRAAGFGEAKVGFAVNEARGTADEATRLQRFSRLWRNGRWMYMNAVAPEVSRDTDSAHESIEILCNSGPVGIDVAKEKLTEAERKIVSDLVKVAIGRGWNKLTDSIRNINWGKSIHEGVNRYFLGRLREGININETEQATGGTSAPGPESGRVEIPKDEKALRLLIRREARKVLSLNDDDSIGAGVVLDKIKLALPGYDPKERETIELFPRGIPNIDKIREEIIEELRARCELHNAQVKEGSYQGMKSTAALAKYVEDSEGNAFREISNGTFEWLKMVRERGDGLTAENVDRAFSVLVWAGEESAPVGFEPLFRQFEGFLGQENIEDKVKNIYDASYPKKTQQEFKEKLAEVFGDDAADLAWQMFQGLRLEGEYKPSHYLFSVTHPAENRDFLATAFKVVIGSSRVLGDETADHRSFKDEIQRLAKLPLLARAKDEKTRNVKVDGLFMDRTNNGNFLRGSNFIDRGKLSVERTAVGQIKQASKVISAWIEIGKLGDKTSDKAGKIDGAVAQLVAIASALNELVDFGAVTLVDAETQLFIEAENIAWELSTQNEINMVPGQIKEDRKFLLPSGYNRMLNLMAKATLDGISAWPDLDGTRYVFLSDAKFKIVAEYIKKLRGESYSTFSSLPTGDPDKIVDLADVEKEQNKYVVPVIRGDVVRTSSGARLARQNRDINAKVDRFRKSLGLPKFRN